MTGRVVWVGKIEQTRRRQWRWRIAIQDLDMGPLLGHGAGQFAKRRAQRKYSVTRSDKGADNPVQQFASAYPQHDGRRIHTMIGRQCCPRPCIVWIGVGTGIGGTPDAHQVRIRTQRIGVDRKIQDIFMRRLRSAMRGAWQKWIIHGLLRQKVDK